MEGRTVPPKKHVVFCTYLDRSEIFYMFYHELDLLLMAFVF